MAKTLNDMIAEALGRGQAAQSSFEDLESLLKSIAGDGSIREKALQGEKIGLEALRARAKAFTTERPFFNVGDLVVPKANSQYENTGVPAVVIMARPAAQPVFTTGGWGTASFGMIPDLRVLRLTITGDMYPVWVESAEFERYVPLANRT